jgi:hypothetical protein
MLGRPGQGSSGKLHGVLAISAALATDPSSPRTKIAKMSAVATRERNGLISFSPHCPRRQRPVFSGKSREAERLGVLSVRSRQGSVGGESA